MPAERGDGAETVSGGGAMTRVKFAVAEVPVESVTRAVKVKVPALVGVPLKDPELDMRTPAGKVPPV